MEVDDVELAATAKHLLQQEDVVRELIDATLVEAQGTRDDRDQACGGHGIAAGKERHVVALRDELFREVRDDALGTAVERGRDALVERRDLRDTKRTGGSGVGGRHTSHQSMDGARAPELERAVQWLVVSLHPLRLPLGGATHDSRHGSVSYTLPEDAEEDQVAKRQSTAPRADRTRVARQPEGMTETIAVYVGRTLGELLNRKDELHKQLAQVEAQIADVSNDVGARVGKYLPKGLSGLRRKTPRKPAGRKAVKRTPRPPHPHGRDRETVVAKVIEKSAGASDRMQRAARPRSAPRATRRG